MNKLQRSVFDGIVPPSDGGRFSCPKCGRDVAWSRRAPTAPTRVARHKRPNTSRRKPRGSPGGTWCDKKVFDWRTDVPRPVAQEVR